MASPIAVITTSPYQLSLFLKSHIDALPPGQQVLIFSNTHDQYAHMIDDLEVRHITLGRSPRITREDLRAAKDLRKELKRAGVSTVLTVSPKAGFVGQLAAFTARIPRRYHLFTGQVWEGMGRGPKRTLVKGADRAIGRMATHLAADSPSQAQSLQHAGVAPRHKPVAVPHPVGSIRGVDLERFRPSQELRDEFRSEHGLSGDAFVFVQLGRLTEAKGVFELAEAFGRLRREWRAGHLDQEPRLLFVGQDEGDAAGRLSSVDGVTVLSFDPRPERILAASDVLVLASHREGFGSTIIEAAAAGIPSIGTDIVGVRDAITDSTGWLVPKQDPDHLFRALLQVISSPDEVAMRGASARMRATEEFASDAVAQAYADHLMAIHTEEKK